MNYKEFAKLWYEGSGFDADTERSLATAIKMSFVSREEIHELKDRLTDAIRDTNESQVDACRRGVVGAGENLRGQVYGLRLVLSYLTEMEATE